MACNTPEESNPTQLSTIPLSIQTHITARVLSGDRQEGCEEAVRCRQEAVLPVQHPQANEPGESAGVH